MTWPANKILRVLASLGVAATAQEITAATGMTLDQVWDACDTLVKNRLASRQDRGVYLITAAGTAALVDGKEIKSGPKGPTGPKVKRGTFRERLWQAIRKERKGTIGNFLSLALLDGEDENKATENAQKYLCVLCQAGYMSRLPGKQRGTALCSNGFTRYILVINSGPLAPVARRVQRQLYDPNTGNTVELLEVAK
ncbi:hypothetical protein GURASL_13310 [Geotalea uraniireducens]|uniref:MarR family transcriptional regulator n=1 Tax=Geotalea uraniireducens TaxID=351604 RepID=A0ABM8EIZ1_9BACT|nr:hypothetical protein [Geotalea uraniireducens]BDV42408.1 hypothetical protein GURASL_13310 [Geotalea uraniireducens]